MLRILTRVVVTYGVTGLVIFLTLHMVVLGAFAAAIWLGWEPYGILENLGTLTVAYILTKFTLPFRLVATAALTRWTVRTYERFRAARLASKSAPSQG